MVHIMKVIGNTIKLLVQEHFDTQQVTFTLVNGYTTNRVDLDYIKLLLELSMRAAGKMTSSMGMA